MTQNAWNAEYNNVKGALLAGNNTKPVVVTVGTDGQLLRADSGAAAGVSWVTVPSAVTWQAVSTNQTIAVNNGYIAIAPGGALTFALPAVSAVGDIFELVLQGATSWQITQGAGQQLFLANSSSTLGAGGSITSTANGDAVRFVCSIANLQWVAVSGFSGNLTVV